MISKIINDLKFKRSYSGLVCMVNGDGTTSISLLETQVIDKEMQIVKEHGLLTENSELSKLGLRSQVGLVIIGEGILFKQVPAQASLEIPEIIKSAFPFLKVEDFFVQLYHTEKDVFISIVKKDTVATILSLLAKHRIFPYSVTLGPFVISQALPLLSAPGFTVVVSGYEIRHDFTDIKEVVSGAGKPDVYETKPEGIKTTLLLNFAAILFMLSPGRIEFSDTRLVESLRREFKYKIFYYTFRSWAAISLLVILFVNVFYFQKYSSVNDALREKHSTAIVLKNRLEEINATYQEKKSFVDSLKLSTSPRMAFYGDRLAKGLPPAIRWEVLGIHPEVRKFNSEVLNFDHERVFVRGTCPDPVVLQKWIGLLQEYDWVKNVEGQKYFYNDEKRVGEFEFSIHLKAGGTNGL